MKFAVFCPVAAQPTRKKAKNKQKTPKYLPNIYVYRKCIGKN